MYLSLKNTGDEDIKVTWACHHWEGLLFTSDGWGFTHVTGWKNLPAGEKIKVDSFASSDAIVIGFAKRGGYVIYHLKNTRDFDLPEGSDWLSVKKDGNFSYNDTAPDGYVQMERSGAVKMEGVGSVYMYTTLEVPSYESDVVLPFIGDKVERNEQSSSLPVAHVETAPKSAEPESTARVIPKIDETPAAKTSASVQATNTVPLQTRLKELGFPDPDERTKQFWDEMKKENESYSIWQRQHPGLPFMFYHSPTATNKSKPKPGIWSSPTNTFHLTWPPPTKTNSVKPFGFQNKTWTNTWRQIPATSGK